MTISYQNNNEKAKQQLTLTFSSVTHCSSSHSTQQDYVTQQKLINVVFFGIVKINILTHSDNSVARMGADRETSAAVRQLTIVPR